MSRHRAVLAAATAVALVGTAALAVPAGAGDPVRDQLAALKRQVTQLRVTVRKLSREKRAAENERSQLRAQVARLRQGDGALRAALARETRCPVTRPNGDTPPGWAASPTNHGNGRLWVGLWTTGVAVGSDGHLRDDGSVDIKYGWWRGVEGALTISGRRVDGPAPPLSAFVPRGYEPSGFQPSGIVFPTEGCWEVTGRVADASLTFVVLLVKP